MTKNYEIKLWNRDREEFSPFFAVEAESMNEALVRVGLYLINSEYSSFYYSESEMEMLKSVKDVPYDEEEFWEMDNGYVYLPTVDIIGESMYLDGNHLSIEEVKEFSPQAVRVILDEEFEDGIEREKAWWGEMVSLVPYLR